MYLKYTTLVVLICTLLCSNLLAQDCENPGTPVPFSANNLITYLQAAGSIFDGDSDSALGIYGLDGNTSPQKSAFAMGLWMGGFDQGGNLKLAAAEFGPSNGRYDYYPGPLHYGELADPDRGTVTTEACSNWNQVWVVSRSEIEAFRADFLDDGQLQDNHSRVFAWPGSGNPQFAQYNGFELPTNRNQGLAPFVDSDADGIYEPADGEYPHVPQSAILPEVMAWSIFNDVGNRHQETIGPPLQFEVRQTTWGYSCTDHPWLNEAIFTSYQITNVAVETLDSLYVGFWSDFDLGCFEDDFVGSIP